MVAPFFVAGSVIICNSLHIHNVWQLHLKLKKLLWINAWLGPFGLNASNKPFCGCHMCAYTTVSVCVCAQECTNCTCGIFLCVISLCCVGDWPLHCTEWQLCKGALLWSYRCRGCMWACASPVSAGTLRTTGATPSTICTGGCCVPDVLLLKHL